MDQRIDISNQIKSKALELGFDACGICRAEPLEHHLQIKYQEWLERHYQAGMDYLTRNVEKRFNPSLLVEQCQSVISVALNYYPQVKQHKDVPQFAYYAYGLDYHDIVKQKLAELLEYIKVLAPKTNGRYFCDTAPVLERYWAAKAGLGFIGKNTLLIIPKKGSYFFLGEILIDIELSYDKPLNISCGKCTRCLDSCPTQAFEAPHVLNSQKCISYLTIENKDEIPTPYAPKFENRLYGCDACQQICPWNRYAKPHRTKELIPKDEFLELDWESINSMQIEDYQRIFKGSAIKRAKFGGLKRNLEAILLNK